MKYFPTPFLVRNNQQPWSFKVLTGGVLEWSPADFATLAVNH